MEEKTRVVQLEAEVEDMKARLQRSTGGPGDASGSAGTAASVSDTEVGLSTELIREQLLSAGREHREESSQLREKYEAALSGSQREAEHLKSTVERQAQEIADLRQRLQQSTRENMDMMDGWKTKLDSLSGDHHRALEELKASLMGERRNGEGEGEDGNTSAPPEVRAAMESLRIEQQLELENQKAKHEIEVAVMSKEREDYRTRLQELRDQLEESDGNWRIQAEVKSGQHVLELKEAADRLQKAEQRLGELEKAHEEQGRTGQLQRERLELAEKKMVDYETLQKAEAQSRAELLTLEEKLRVSENRLQAMEADRTTQDANVSNIPLKHNIPLAVHLSVQCVVWIPHPHTHTACVLTGNSNYEN